MPALLAAVVTAVLVALGGGAAAAQAPGGAGDDAAQEGPDSGLARRMLVRRSDLPRGWRRDDGGGADDALRCRALSRAARAATGGAAAPTFARGTALVGSIALVFARAAPAERHFARLTSRRMQRCLASTFTEILRAAARGRARIGRIRTRRLRAPRIGDERHAARMTIPFTTQGVRLRYLLDVVHVRVGRGLALEFFGDALQPFDRVLRDGLLATVAGRMDRALGRGAA